MHPEQFPQVRQVKTFKLISDPSGKKRMAATSGKLGDMLFDLEPFVQNVSAPVNRL